VKAYNILTFGKTEQLAVFVTSILSIFAPLTALAIVVFAFIFIDFILGLIVSIRVKKEGFITEKAWHTVWKLVGAEVCILLAWVLDTHVLTFAPSLALPNVFAGFVCGADLWSILTNFGILSNHPVFRLIKKWGKDEIKSKIGMDLSELDDNDKNKIE